MYMYVYITFLMIMFLSYRNPSTDLHCKWRDCFLFEQNIAINRLIIRVGYFPSIAFNETQICVSDFALLFKRQCLFVLFPFILCNHSLNLFPRQEVLILFTRQEFTLQAQNIFARQKIRELNFANQTLKLTRIAELKIANE